MKKIFLSILICITTYFVQAQTKSKVYNCTSYGARDGAIDLIISGGKAPYSFIWSNGSTEEDQKNLASGRYTVTISDVTGRCSIESSFDVAQPLSNGSVTDQSHQGVYTSRFDVYPNPTENKSTISFYNSDNAGFTIRVLNTSGAEIYNEIVKDVNGEYNHIVDFNGMAKGIYLVEIKSQKESITKQLIVQ